jgi:hypothetical protein
MSNTNDSISRKAAVSELKREASCGDRDYEKGLEIAADIVELLPSAQPEIIRCKDCKHKRRYKFPPKYNEKDYCSINERVVPLDAFCSWAERRADE